MNNGSEAMNPRIAELFEQMRCARKPESSRGRDAIEAIRSLDITGLRAELTTWEDASTDDVDNTIEWVAGLAEDLVRVLSSIDDDADVVMNAAIKYIELKSQWIGMNTLMNYSCVRGEQPRAFDVLRGTAVSSLLAIVEQFVQADDLDAISAFLAEPIQAAA